MSVALAMGHPRHSDQFPFAMIRPALARAVLLVLLPCLGLAACEPAAPTAATPPAQADSPAVAMLDGQPLSRALLDQLAAQQAGHPDPYAPPAAAAASAPQGDRHHLLKELVDIELLARKAQERGLDRDPAIQPELELQARTVVAQAMLREQIVGLSVSDAELAAAYEERVPPHEFEVAHIVLPDAGAAQAVLDQLREGRAFAALARRHSTDPGSRDQGGRLGWRMYDQLPAALADAVRQLSPGAHATGAVQTAEGWHVVRLLGLRPLAERPALDTARAWLYPALMQAKVRAQQDTWRKEATVQAPPVGASSVLVTVNGQALGQPLLDELARARGAAAAPTAAAERERLIDELVTMELMAQRARSTGVAARPGTRAELELARKTLLGQRLLERLSTEMPVDDATLQERYRALPGDEEIDASHILLADESTARDVISQLQRGASFAALARRHSLDTGSRARGGALGRAPSSEFSPPFAAAARALRPGRHTTEPVRTEFGWHVIRLKASRPLQRPTFETLRASLRAQVVSERLQAQLDQWRKEAKLSVLPTP